MSDEQTPQDQTTAAAEVLQPQPHKESANDESRFERFKTWYSDHKKWTIPASVLILILVLAGAPFTRYNLAGLVLKHDLTVKVVDSTASTPVSGVTVSQGSLSVQTDSSGVATLKHLKVGHHKITLSKKYYQTKTVDELVPVFSKKTQPSVGLVATGRQLKITVSNLINKNPVADAEIKVAGTSSKTDQTGTAVIVIPADASDQKATITADGFNDSEVILKASSNQTSDNKFNLTPAGKVYFLSKLSGKIDVVKTNLDGTDRKTVLAGTGTEDDRNTVLLASRDWKYLALLSRRAGSNPSLYLISTADDSLTVIDSGTSDFTLTGWAGDDFVYTVNHSDVQLWQPGRQVIKSYDAAAKKAVVLDQNTASGTSNFDYVSQLVGDVYAYDNQVFYIMNWTSAFNDTAMTQLAAKQATFNSIKPDGTAKKAIRSFGLAAGAQTADITVDERVKNPSTIELHFSDGSKDNFYTYADGQVKDDTSLSVDSFFGATYPTYLLSPTGNKTFWSEPRDGKNTLFVGDEGGQNSNQIATLSDYNTYGWYSDDYLLVSKNSSELYIMDNAGKQTPVKISDYHKPAQTFPGYGGGYGGF